MEAKRSIASPVLFIENTHGGPQQETFTTVEGLYCEETFFSVSLYQKKEDADKMLSLPSELCVTQMK